MPARSSWFAAKGVALLLVAGAVAGSSRPADAATILDKTVRHHVGSDGSVLETTRLDVRLETRDDVHAWSSYAIYLDDHRTLESVDAWVTLPDGRTEQVKKKHQDEIEAASAGELHSSARYHRLEFPGVREGAKVVVEHRVRVTPYFPGGSVAAFDHDEPVASLSVEVTGMPPGFRWHVAHPQDDLRLQETGSGLRWVGEGLEPPEAPDLAPADAGRGPVLRYAWGPATTWKDVALWYEELTRELPPTSTVVREKARELIRDIDNPRQRLEALLAHARRSVRYVAVEVGVGGFRPSPAVETLERGWGDCKDKSTLLIELLAEAGIEAHPALILSSPDERIDAGFPSPFVFNHLIVAVETERLATEPTDPVSEGLLFVDPTHEKGTSKWLHGAVQSQQALVIRGERSGLVPTPALAGANVRDLSVDLEIDAGGTGRGTAELTLTGDYGSAVQELVAAVSTDRMEGVVRRVFSSLLPAVEVERVGWGFDDGGVPHGSLRADVSFAGLIPTAGERLSFQLPGLSGTPSMSILDDRTVPLVLDAGTARDRWTMTLPREGCTPETDDVSVDTAAGSYAQSMSVDGARLVVERSLVLPERWIEPQDFEALRELALAETRSKKRRLRLVCE